MVFIHVICLATSFFKMWVQSFVINLFFSQPLGQAPAVSVVETGPIATGIGLIDLIAVRDGRDAMAGAARPKSARGASAESRRSTAGGVETVGQRMSPCVAWPA